VNKYIDQLVEKNALKNNTLLQTDLISLQISNSQVDVKKKSDQIAKSFNLSVIDFENCEKILLQKKVIDSHLVYSKTDWDSSVKTGNLVNVNKTDSNSVSYALYTKSGKKVDLSSCSNTTTSINVHINNYNASFKSNISDYNVYDVDSPYYKDRCIPIKYNDEKNIGSILDKQNSFNTNNITCGISCSYKSINITDSYLTCICNANKTNIEVSPEYGKVLMNVIESINLDIIKCYFIAFIFVIFLLILFSLIFLQIMDSIIKLH
jgi:hypothetical protein